MSQATESRSSDLNGAEQASLPARVSTLIYGTTCYLIFFVTFCYLIGFVGNLLVPKSIDSGTPGPAAVAVGINLLLLSLFALQHSVMARPAFKRWWKRIVPQQIERSTYVLLTSLCLILLVWQWQPMPHAIWDTSGTPIGALLTGLFFAGWGLVLYATVLIDHFDLFGMRQVVLYMRRRKYGHHPFSTPSMYLYMRHPLYLGWFIAFWAAPTMTVGHLLFAFVMTSYILVAVIYEERDLVRQFGDAYVRYQETTPKFFPTGRGRRRRAAGLTPAGQR